MTSAVYSPRLELNIALAMVAVECSRFGTLLSVSTPSGPAPVVPKPFFDPDKKVVAGA